jgi:hypothetical protein
VTDIDTVEVEPQPTYHLGRASGRTDAEREAHWQRGWSKFWRAVPGCGDRGRQHAMDDRYGTPSTLGAQVPTT